MALPHCHHWYNGWGWHKGLGVRPYLRVLETCQSARQLTGKLQRIGFEAVTGASMMEDVHSPPRTDHFKNKVGGGAGGECGGWQV